MAQFGPYKLWMADMWQCPECKTEIVAGFARKHFAEHYEPDFDSKLEKLKASDYIMVEAH